MELKNCPFCGGEVTMMYNSYSKEFRIYHSGWGTDCKVIEPIAITGVSLADAAETWNRRCDNG